MVSITTFALHQVDRDPENGMYGGNRILTEEFGDLQIVSYDMNLKTIIGQDLFRTRPRICLQLSTDKSDRDFFERKIVKRWNEELKKNYEGDEDFTDYLPGFYASLEDMYKGKLELYR